MAGQPRKPAAIREAEGNRGKRPIPTEPDYPTGIPDRPAMSPAGQRVWDELVGQTGGSGVLRDKRALAQLCENEALVAEIYAGIWSTMREIKKLARDKKAKIPGGAFYALLGTEKGKAAFNALRDLAKMTGLERQQFGLTPSSRSKVQSEVMAVMDDWETAQCATTSLPIRDLQ